MQTLLSRHSHHLPHDEVVTLLESDRAKKLDMLEVAHRHTHFGPNRLMLKKATLLVISLLQFHQPLVYILLGARLAELSWHKVRCGRP